MNKLVSKNPIQRFKEGRKIVKAQQGNDTKKWGTYAGIPDQVSNFEYQRQYPNDIAIGPGMFKDPNNGNIYSTRVDDGGFIMISKSNPPKTKEISLPSGLGHIVKDQKNLQKDLKNPPSKKERVSLINNRWVNGIKRRNEITDVRATQQMLKDAGFNIGKFGVDGKWGRDTEAAYQKYLIANAAKTPSLEDTISAAQNQPILSTPTINPSEYTFTESQLSGLGENPYYEPNPELRFNNFDRTQTRQWLRNNGFNPYSLTGAQRKALRMILNGQGTEQDKNLIGLTGGLSEILTNYKYLKQGGNILPSRNIVKRFKLQKGNKLPNAPKAEDRFKNGVKDSVAYLGVPGKDNTYFGESIKRVTTPDNAAIQRQILFRYYPHDNDTIYTEVPEHTNRIIFPKVNVQSRKGFSFAKTPDYEILKRRFNSAWNLK